MNTSVDPANSSNRRPWLMCLALLLLFASGVVVGVIGLKLMIQQKVNSIVQGTPENFAAAAVELLDTHLHCTSEQKLQIQKILLDTLGDLKKIRRPIETQLVDRIRRGANEIDQILEPEQQKLFEPKLKLAEERYLIAERYWKDRETRLPGE